jgi:hypothetical protein
MGVGSIQPFLSATEVYTMQGETREDWMKLCERAAVEQDPEKLIRLAKEIDRMLGDKEYRLLRKRDDQRRGAENPPQGWKLP